MVPPKKDAFADLFQSASGGSSLGLNRSLNNLSLGDQKLQANKSTTHQSSNVWSNLDILSPTLIGSPVASGTQSPAVGKVADPFDIFQESSQRVQPSPAPRSQNGASSVPSVAPKTDGDFLLDDEFTDAFVLETPTQVGMEVLEEFREYQEQTIVEERPRQPAPRGESDPEMERDSVLAGLVDIGFSLETSNQAIDAVGPDTQRCVNFIMGGSQNGLGSGASRTQSPDLGATIQDLSSDIFKRATKLLDKSRRTVIKNINNFQQQGRDDSMPAWMRNQQKYKESALERKNDGSVYEDYGQDEDNINAEEIQRIIRTQREKERERQKLRLESGRKLVSPSPSLPSRPTSSRPAASRSNSSQQSGSTPRVPISRTPSTQPEITRKQGATQKSEPPLQPVAKKAEEPSIDLLGLGTPSLSRAERFKQKAEGEVVYSSPARRRGPRTGTTRLRVATSEPLNTFQQSDFEIFKGKATTAFTNGDYGDALASYLKCMEALPPKHELRIVITSNLALTAFKLGDYKVSKARSDEGIELVGDSLDDDSWTINEKPIKYWYVKLLTKKAESLEMLENFADALDCYMALITKHGVNDKKTMDAKRRINKIVNPPKAPAVSRQAPSRAPAPPSNTESVDRIRKKHDDEKMQDEMKFRLHDQVHERIQQWTNGKEDNLRSLLMSLSEVLPERLGFPFITTKKLTISDLMLTKKVKINYMKVISSIHPDKLSKFALEDQMICQAVFIALNKAWDAFKEQNNIA